MKRERKGASSQRWIVNQSLCARLKGKKPGKLCLNLLDHSTKHIQITETNGSVVPGCGNWDVKPIRKLVEYGSTSSEISSSERRFWATQFSSPAQSGGSCHDVMICIVASGGFRETSWVDVQREVTESGIRIQPSPFDTDSISSRVSKGFSRIKNSTKQTRAFQSVIHEDPKLLAHYFLCTLKKKGLPVMCNTSNLLCAQKFSSLWSKVN